MSRSTDTSSDKSSATRAQAHPNIALIKYWGKSDTLVNLPSAPSLSITLDTLVTETSVTSASGNSDEVWLDGEKTIDLKIAGWLVDLRQRFGLPPLEIHSTNNFPTASGLASSASGFAALITAINVHFELGLDNNQCSIWARRASASAARSMQGDWATLSGPHWHVESLEANWPMRVIVAITDATRKAVSSSVGMAQSKDTSPYYPAWVETTTKDFATATDLVAEQNFAGLAELAEHSCLKMHGLMMSTQPGLLYWKPATLAVIHAIRELRADGVPVFFTVDAGPQVKAVCLPEAATAVEEKLAGIEGVQQTLNVGLGPGAQIVNATTP